MYLQNILTISGEPKYGPFVCNETTCVLRQVLKLTEDGIFMNISATEVLLKFLSVILDNINK